MALGTYSELKDAVTDTAFRSGDAGFEASVPRFIAMAESDMNSALRVAQMEKTASVTLSNGTGDLPEDFLEFRSLTAGSPTTGLSVVTPEFAVATHPTNYGGLATQFTRIGSQFSTYPRGTGPVSLTYYAKIPALTDDQPTNWLLSTSSNAYLYGALVHGAVYTMDDAAVPRWMTMFRAAIEDLKRNDIGSRYGRASMRVTGPTP